jgi:succinate-acetate transporter protein
MSDNNGQNDLPVTEKKKAIIDNQIDYLLSKLQNTPLIVNRLDYYGNSIPLGAFCFATSFIIFGFYECEVFDKPDPFSFAVILLFGGVGQITAGIFEYIKSRTYPTIVYLLYGLYFISLFLCFYYNTEIFSKKDCKKIFYGTWAGLSFPLVIGSLQTNAIYLLQNLSVFAFFIIRCIGECRDIIQLNKKVSGIMELVTGFLSLYLCFSQVLNEHFRRVILPAFPLKKDNEIDLNIQNS